MAPNPIDFDKVFAEFGKLGETGNFVVLSFVCVVFGLYAIGLVFARRADKKDDLEVSNYFFFLHRTRIDRFSSSHFLVSSDFHVGPRSLS